MLEAQDESLELRLFEVHGSRMVMVSQQPAPIKDRLLKHFGENQDRTVLLLSLAAALQMSLSILVDAEFIAEEDIEVMANRAKRRKEASAESTVPDGLRALGVIEEPKEGDC